MTMRNLILMAILGLVTVFGLSACNKAENTAAQTQTEAAPTKPSSPTDSRGWKQYLSYLVTHNLDGMTASSPYVYYVPAGDDPETMGKRMRQLNAVQGAVARTVLPGNLLAFGGPDSSTTADFLIKSFKPAEKGSFEGVIVLFIGDQADKARVLKALKPTDATVHFVQM